MTKIDLLVAKDEIRELSARYMRALDRREPALQRAVFWPDSTTDYGIFTGSGPEFVDFAQTLLADHQANLHLLGQMLIDIEGDIAFGEIYYLAYHRIAPEGTPQDLIIAGRYIDRYECREGVWKIAHRSELIDWVRADPAADGFLAQIPQALLGGHGDADRSNQREWLRHA